MIYNNDTKSPVHEVQKDLYRFFESVSDGNGFFDNDVRRDLANVKLKKEDGGEDKYSENSLCFRNNINKVFDLEGSATFSQKYRQATSGDGKEKRRIRTLHSSALLAFLVFQGVSEKNPLRITLKDGQNAIFTESYFEMQNPIQGNNQPSNMDVTLVGHKEGSPSQEIVLFLESKFSEYLSNGKVTGISGDVYGRIYSRIFTGERKWDMVKEDIPDGTITIASKPKTSHYCTGIKQMISHYLGATNSVRQGWNLLVKKQHQLDKDADYYLGEILFDFGSHVRKAQDKFKDYSALYKELAETLNTIAEEDGEKLSVLSEDFTYQELLKKNPDFNPGEYVKRFYGF